MKYPNKINTTQMRYLLALVNNKFSQHSAAVDMNTESSHIGRTMVLIEEYCGYSVFVRGVRKYHNTPNAILGFTEKGQNLYFSIKTFLESIMLIQKESNSGD